MEHIVKETDYGFFLKTNHNPDWIIKRDNLDYTQKNIPYHLTYDYYMNSIGLYMGCMEATGFAGVPTGTRWTKSNHFKLKGKRKIRSNKNSTLVFHVIEGNDIEFNYTNQKSPWCKSFFGEKQEVITHKLIRGDAVYLSPDFPFHLKGEGMILHHELGEIPPHGQG